MLNKIMLITYPDSMGHDLKDLHHILNLYFKDAVKMVHILPFFPSSGDRGFAPLGYEKGIRRVRRLGRYPYAFRRISIDV